MGTLALWIAFNSGILLLLVLDLGVFHRRAHAVSIREAAAWSVFWIVLSLAFNAWILHGYGSDKALQFFTGYLIEKSLSVDNIFIFILIFRSFGVEPRYQHRVLFWGVLGALVLRGAMIGLGSVLIARFEWVLYLFGAFLVIAAFRMMLRKKKEQHPENSRLLRWARKLFPVSRDYQGQRLWIREAGRRVATPLLLVLLVIEGADLVFALDSIPAVFSITRDPFIVYTSNVCAILGLRALYFLLAGALPYFQYLDEGLSAVLLFVGAKMLVVHWYDIPTGIALAVVAGILAIAVIASLIAPGEKEGRAKPLDSGPKKYEAVLIGENWTTPKTIAGLSDSDFQRRWMAVNIIFGRGCSLSLDILKQWEQDKEFASLLVHDPSEQKILQAMNSSKIAARATVGVAVLPETFNRIREANGSPNLAEVPPDQDAMEFELHLTGPVAFGEQRLTREFRLDILTTKQLGGDGAIAKFLAKFGEEIQQVEYEVTDVDRATQILADRFGQKAVYPATRPGADGTRVNFFLASLEVAVLGFKKILIELVEPAR